MAYCKVNENTDYTTKEVIMGVSRKRLFLICFILIIPIFLFLACNIFQFETFDASKDNDTTKVSITPTPEEEHEDEEDVASVPKSAETAMDEENMEPTKVATPTPSVIQPTANKELSVFTVNIDSGDIQPITALVPEGSAITPELIVNTVVEAMEDQSIVVGIDSITTESDAIIVSFKSDKAPLDNVGAGYEVAILDAIAQSLIDNTDYHKVIYRVEGKEYVSGHIQLGINEVYLGD